MVEIGIKTWSNTIWEAVISHSGLLNRQQNNIKNFINSQLSGENYDAVENSINTTGLLDDEEKEVAINSINKERRTLKKGDVIVAISDNRRRQVWVEMLCRGTHGYSQIPFDQSLFDKYMNFTNNRSHNISDSQLNELRTDIQNSHILVNSPQVPLGNKFVHQVWPWGRKDIVDIFIVNMDSSEFTDENEIKSLHQFDEEITLVGDEFVHRHIKMRNKRINFEINSSQLQLDQTLRYIRDDVSISQRSRDWIRDNVLSYPGITLNSSILDVVNHRQVRLPNRWWLTPFSKTLIEDKT